MPTEVTFRDEPGLCRIVVCALTQAPVLMTFPFPLANYTLDAGVFEDDPADPVFVPEVVKVGTHQARMTFTPAQMAPLEKGKPNRYRWFLRWHVLGVPKCIGAGPFIPKLP